MRARIVPNWMLYDMIRDMKNELKEDIVRVETKVDKGIERLEEKIDENSHKIDEISQGQDKVKITFSRTFAFGTIFFSMFISYITALFSRNQ